MRNKKISLLGRVFRRLKYKNMLNWMPDALYLKLSYYYLTGNTLDLKNPKTFDEKLNWLKLYDRQDLYTTMVDKYAVKKYVASLIGQEHVIPTLGVWDRVKDIDFDSLPNQFVLKFTHNSGGILICKDKSKLDKEMLDKSFTKFLKTNYFYLHREWPYKNVKPRIIAEKLMKDDKDTTGVGLVDHKFYCFNGEPKYLYVATGFGFAGGDRRISFVDLDWKLAPFRRTDYQGLKELPEKPSRFDEMVELARFFAKGHRFLRVDLYQINDEIYFSEFTFTPSAGRMELVPRKYERILGDQLVL